MGLPVASPPPPSILLGLANTWTQGQTISPQANQSGLVVSGYSLTGANAQSLLDLSGTWNTTGAPLGLKLNITDTASGTGSALADFQVGGVSKVTIGNKNLGRDTIVFDGGPLGMGAVTSSILGIGNVVSPVVGVSGSPFTVRFIAASTIGFTSANYTAAIDTPIARDAAGIWAQRNGVNAQVSRVYGTFTDASNNTWTGFDYQTTAGTPRLRAVAVGTGVAAPLAIDAYQKAGAAVAADIPAGTWALVRDTSGSTTKLIYNNAGTLMSVALT